LQIASALPGWADDGVNVGEIRRAQAWDPVARARLEYENAPAPSFRTHGPRTRREMLGLLRAERDVFG
jgi:hypothetical protein